MSKMKILLFLALLSLVFWPWRASLAATQQEIEQDIANKNQQIEELQKQIDALQGQAAQKQEKASSIQGEIQRLANEVKKSELEIQGLNLAIQGTNLQINKVEDQIKQTEVKIENGKADLISALRVMARSEQMTPLEMIVGKKNLSSFFSDLYDLYFLQSGVKQKVEDLKDAKLSLTTMQDALSDEMDQRQKLKTLEEITRQQAANKRAEQKKVLSQVQKEASQINSKIKVVQTDLSRLKEQITFLVQSGVSVEDAVRYGKLAAIRSGIRPAFLIAVLDVESRLGLNVGKGTYQKDMHERDKDAFLAICQKLNLDPDQTPVSKKPSYGWGGAMGPAQFLPNTWLAYEKEVARLTGHNPPSPWSIEDAFTAAAIKLASQGAAKQTSAGEIAAAKAYIGGSPSCSKSICNFYANTVLDKAKEIEKDLGS